MPTLQVRHPDGSESVQSLEGNVLTFGRSGDNGLLLDGKGVSRRHGRLRRGAEGDWWVEDAGSTNGILVGGRYVTQHRLQHNDTIAVGEVMLTFQADRPESIGTTARGVTITDGLPIPPATVERSPSAVGAMDGRRLTALYEISKRLLDQRDVPGLIDEASAALVAALDAEVVVFGLTCDPDNESDRVLVRPASMQASQVALSRSVLRRTLDARRAVLVPDTGSDRSLAVAQSIVAGRIRSALCVPLMRGDDVTGFIYVDSRRSDRSYGDGELEFACAIGAMVGTAVENARLHEAELVRQRMQAELASARQVQEAIMPSSWPRLDGWAVYGQHAMCREVGGDYYDAIVTRDGRLWLLVADVAGKGVPAALMASSVHAAVHALITQCDSPAQLLARINELLMRRASDQPFVTCLAVVITPETGETLIASAGHPYPIYVSEAGGVQPVPVRNGLVLGVAGTINVEDTSWSFPPAPGTLVMYTDGVSEALNETGQQFGDEKLQQVLSQCRAGTPEDIVSAVSRGIEAFRGDHRQTDDLTLLACTRGARAACS